MQFKRDDRCWARILKQWYQHKRIEIYYSINALYAGVCRDSRLAYL